MGLKLLFVLALFVSCGEKSTDQNIENKQSTKKRSNGTDSSEVKQNNSAPAPSSHTVMIIDDGFDSSIDAIAPNLVAEYTITCDSEDDPKDRYEIPSKSEFIDELLDRENKVCTLSNGIKPVKTDSLRRFDESKYNWNRLTEVGSTNGRVDFDALDDISGILDQGGYHGTSTAGLIGDENKGYNGSGVDLVLVQYELSSAGELQEKYEEACPTQKYFDTITSYMTDPDIIDAFNKVDPSAVDQQFHDLTVEHGITLYNQSFGTEAIEVQESRFKKAGCGSLNMGRYSVAMAELYRGRDEYRNQQNVLRNDYILGVIAAGNSGVSIKDTSDSDDCPVGSNGSSVMVGSHDADYRTISKFSNRGDCVEFFTLGSEVIVPAPAGFKTVSNGTSFSAPLFVRYVTQNIKPGLTALQMADAVRKKINGNGFLPRESFAGFVAPLSATETLGK